MLFRSGHQGPRTRRGRPLMADATMGKRILDRVSSFSTKYSTKVKQKDGIGIVTP